VIDLPQNAEMTVLKTATYVDANGDGAFNAGDRIDYVITITSIGNVTLTNVTIDDALVGINNQTVGTGTLLPGDVETINVSYTLTQADIDAGGVSNQATVTYTDQTGAVLTNDSDDPADATDADDADTEPNADPDDPTYVDIPIDPQMSVIKTATYVDVNGDSVYNAGDRIDYVITITSTGNVTLSNVTIDDALVGISNQTVGTGTMLPGDVETINVSYTLTQSDIDTGSVSNQATVTYDDPNGNTATNDSDNGIGVGPDNDNADTEPYNDPDDPTVIDIPQDPRMDVLKTATCERRRCLQCR